MYQNAVQFSYTATDRAEVWKEISDDVSVLENEDEELPRPETVTVCVLQDEHADDSNSFPDQDLAPFDVDPLSVDHVTEAPLIPSDVDPLSEEYPLKPLCVLIKQEPEDDSEVKVEHTDSDDLDPESLSECVPEDDGYRSASDEGTANRVRPDSHHLGRSDMDVTRNERAADGKEQIPEGHDVSSGVRIPEVVNSRTEARPKQHDASSKEFSKVTKAGTIHKRDFPDKVGEPVTDASKILTARSSKENAKIKMCAALSFPKSYSKQKKKSVNSVLSATNINERLACVVLSRCEEAERQVSSIVSAGQMFESDDQNCIQEDETDAGIIKENPPVVHSTIMEMEKIPRMRLRKVNDTSGWEMAPAVANDLRSGSKSSSQENQTPVGRKDSSGRQEEQTSNEEVPTPNADGEGTLRTRGSLPQENFNKDAALWRCTGCSKVFKNIYAVSGHTAHCLLHIKGQRNKILNPYKCKLCGKTLGSKIALLRHSAKHRGSPKFRCRICGKCFLFSYNLKEHLEMHNSYKCEVCEKTFATMKSLRIHKTKGGHYSKILFGNANCMTEKESNASSDLSPCEVNLPVPQATSLLRGEKVFWCKVCGKLFSTSLKLKVHIRLHGKEYQNAEEGKTQTTGSKNLHFQKSECPVCGKIVSNRRFKEHLERHGKFESYQCHLCQREFYSNHHFRLHLNEHTAEQQCKYDTNGIVYRKSDAMKKRKNSHGHVDELSEVSFRDHQELEKRKHCISKSNIDDVHKNIPPGDPLKIHSHIDDGGHLHGATTDNTSAENSPNAECNMYGKIVRKRNMKLHMHTRKPFQCDICDRTLSNVTRLKDHIRSQHTFEKPYQCNLCEKAYSGHDSLRNHKSKVHKLKPRIKSKSTLNSNSNENEYKCDKCDIVLSGYRSLERHSQHCHMKVIPVSKDQTNREIYKCDLCTKTFNARGYLVRHKNYYHLRKKNKESGRMYKCEQCDATFNRSISLNQHNERFHTAKDQVTSAVKYHSNEKIFKCNKCNATYNVHSHLIQHYREVHIKRKPELSAPKLSLNEKPYQCDKCVATFTCCRTLLQHYRCFHMGMKQRTSVSHSKEKPNVCNLCGARFSLLYNLKRHKRNVHMGKQKELAVIKSREKVHKCDHCDTSFVFKHSLLEHIRCYHPEKIQKPISLQSGPSAKLYKCDICDARFKLPRTLLRHNRLYHVDKSKELTAIKIHPNVKNYKCEQCNATFIDHNALLRHASRCHVQHKTNKKYSCNLCDAKYTAQWSVWRHKRTHHMGEHNYQCSICSKAFSSESELTNHHEEHVKKQHVCSWCGKSFEVLKDLEVHVATHASSMSFHCDICLVIFSSAHDLEDHMCTPKEAESFQNNQLIKTPVSVGKPKRRKVACKQFKCRHCGRVFSVLASLKRHEYIHTNEFPYPCRICGHGFRENYKLVLHMHKHSTHSLK